MEMKTKIFDKKHIIVISITIISIIIGVISATYAYFSDRKDKEIIFGSTSNFGGGTLQKTNVVLSGDLSTNSRLTNANDENNLLSIKFDDTSEYDYYVSLIAEVDPNETTFLEENGSSLTYEVYHKTDKTLDTSSFTCENKEYTNGENTDYCETGTFENSLDGTPLTIINKYLINDTNTHYFDVYISNKDQDTNKIKVNFYLLVKQKYNPKPNVPDISNGLVPVKYVTNEDDYGNWVITTKDDDEWYNYDKQKWANAVSLDLSTDEKKAKLLNEDGTYKVGTELKLPDGTSTDSDILAMFVWIPRYSYTIGCTSSTSCYGYKIDGASDLAQATPGAIDIKFVDKDTTENYTGESPTYTYTSEADRNPTNYYTHPAFNFGNDKLTGIWVGKFETSVNPNSTCYDNLINKDYSASTNCQASKEDVTPRILPNVLSLVYQNVYNEFETAKKFASNTMYGLTNKTDSHMMKNSEWGAVVYLSQSIYGKYGNQNYEGTNKEIYKNDSGASWSRYTGRSQGLAPATNSYSEEGTYKYDDISTADGTKVANSGTGASTTGNIYGVYDMSGGAQECVMVNYGTETDGVFTGTVASSSITFSDIDIKYYDKFTTTTPSTTKSNETIGQAYVETASWYSDSSGNLKASSPWVIRGGYFSYSSDAGAFYSRSDDGYGNTNFSFRSVLATIE